MNVLLLGNGFDLNCGLPTKYINFLQIVDFLEQNKKKVKEILFLNSKSMILGFGYKYSTLVANYFLGLFNNVCIRLIKHCI